MVRRKQPAPVVDLHGVRERVLGAQKVIGGAVEDGGGSVEVVRPGRMVLALPGEQQRIALSVREIDYLPDVLRYLQERGGPIPSDLRQVFIERGLLDPEEAPS